MSDYLQPHGLYSSWNSSGQNTGVGSLSLLQGIFPTQGLNWISLHCRRILYQRSYQGSPNWIYELRFCFEVIFNFRANLKVLAIFYFKFVGTPSRLFVLPANYMNFTHVTESLRVEETSGGRKLPPWPWSHGRAEYGHLQRDSLIAVLVGFPALLGRFPLGHKSTF